MKPLLALIVLLISIQSMASETGMKPQDAPAGWERYKILGQRNIFSKERGKPERRSEERKEKETPPPPKPESEIQLIGILQKDGQFAALFENSATGVVKTVRSGESIARGKVAAITLDSIEYVFEGASTIVSIGKTLEGGAASIPSEKPKSAAAEPGSSDSNAILERMRKKRQEEMRK